ncbi:MAG: helix-turn-helix transcriptional regulator [Anaerolineae bacterium]|nr:helix-turn-helix transcriptional regulator [Anaerolineae bacterium]
MNNEEIAERIKLARKERGFTQSELAELLNRTPSNISDIERSRVQVSAVDLYLISQFLNKPIEYFYGEEFRENDIQDLVAVIRKQPPEVRKESIRITKMLLAMQQMGDKFQGDDKKPSIEEIQEFFTSFITFAKNVNEINDKVNKIRDMFIKSLKEQGIDLTGV